MIGRIAAEPLVRKRPNKDNCDTAGTADGLAWKNPPFTCPVLRHFAMMFLRFEVFTHNGCSYTTRLISIWKQDIHQ